MNEEDGDRLSRGVATSHDQVHPDGKVQQARDLFHSSAHILPPIMLLVAASRDGPNGLPAHQASIAPHGVPLDLLALLYGASRTGDQILNKDRRERLEGRGLKTLAGPCVEFVKAGYCGLSGFRCAAPKHHRHVVWSAGPKWTHLVARQDAPVGEEALEGWMDSDQALVQKTSVRHTCHAKQPPVRLPAQSDDQLVNHPWPGLLPCIPNERAHPRAEGASVRNEVTVDVLDTARGDGNQLAPLVAVEAVQNRRLSGCVFVGNGEAPEALLGVATQSTVKLPDQMRKAGGVRPLAVEGLDSLIVHKRLHEGVTSPHVAIELPTNKGSTAPDREYHLAFPLAPSADRLARTGLAHETGWRLCGPVDPPGVVFIFTVSRSRGFRCSHRPRALKRTACSHSANGRRGNVTPGVVGQPDNPTQRHSRRGRRPADANSAARRCTRRDRRGRRGAGESRERAPRSRPYSGATASIGGAGGWLLGTLAAASR